MSDTSKVLATKFTDDRFPIEWKDEGEKSLMWFYDDLHCPNPISPLYFDIGGWWDCDGRWGPTVLICISGSVPPSARPGSPRRSAAMFTLP